MLFRLGALLGETRYLDAAEQTVKAAWNSLGQMPHVHGALLHALEEMLYGLEVVVIRSDRPQAWHRISQRGFQPRRIVVCLARDIDNLPPALASKTATETDCAYLCRGFHCSPPLSSPEALQEALEVQASDPDNH